MNLFLFKTLCCELQFINGVNTFFLAVYSLRNENYYDICRIVQFYIGVDNRCVCIYFN